MDDCFDNCAESFSNMRSGTRCGLLSLCAGFIALIVYIAVAIEGVEPTEFAIVRNNLNQDIDQEKILEGGLHWVGLFYSLIHYPAIHKSIEFSDDHIAQQGALKSRTKEGLELQVHFAFQYQLKKENLPTLYRYFQDDYEIIFSRMARNSVLHISGNYVAPSYWLEREEVGLSMKKQLIEDLAAAYADITGFMLLKIDLPDSYEGAIVETEITNQQKLTYTVMKEVNMTQQAIENKKAESLKEITEINANAASDATIELNEGAGEVAKQSIEWQTMTMVDVANQLKFKGNDKAQSILEYYSYLKINGLGPDTNNKLQVGSFNTSVMTY